MKRAFVQWNGKVIRSRHVPVLFFVFASVNVSLCRFSPLVCILCLFLLFIDQFFFCLLRPFSVDAWVRCWSGCSPVEYCWSFGKTRAHLHFPVITLMVIWNLARFTALCNQSHKWWVSVCLGHLVSVQSCYCGGSLPEEIVALEWVWSDELSFS